MSEAVFPTSEFLREENNMVRPERYGKPWLPGELRVAVVMYATDYPLKEICLKLKRPGEGVLAKLESLGLLNRNPNTNSYHSVVPPELRMKFYQTLVEDPESPLRTAGKTGHCRTYMSHKFGRGPNWWKSLEIEPKDTVSTLLVLATSTSVTSAPDKPNPYVGLATNAQIEEAYQQTKGTNMQTITIDNTVPHQDLTLIFGKPVKDMADTDYLNAIRTMETQIANLKSVKTESKKIKASIKDLETQLAKIVAAYDAT